MTETCDVSGCDNEAVARVIDTDDNLSDDGLRCKPCMEQRYKP